ncbi:putative at dna binding protein [Phaeomoniella chlamydospora]|uniref:Putative at dna binding protein n=1 Tax=Phaeomoniella chlamydospora TaxID=158046 RepID=A0A0G2GKK1_PHACM|nr:putative at dna binding protein [Phaeomoniella chlamydospora]
MSQIHDHSPTPARNVNIDFSRYSDSSPDPLQSSATLTRRPRSSPTRRSLSPKKNDSARSVRLHDLTINTPPTSKFYRRQFEPGARPPPLIASQQLPEGTSPWRIRVTVEAEPESGSDGHTEYETGPNMQTRTTKVPLRGGYSEDDTRDLSEVDRPTNAQKGNRGRAAAATSPVKGRKRSATPARRKSAPRRKSLTDLDATVLGDDSDDPDAKPKRQRSKTKARKQTSKQHNSNVENGPDNISGIHNTADLTKTNTRRQNSKSRAFDIAEDLDVNDTPDPQKRSIENESPSLRRIDPNTVSVRSKVTKSTQITEDKFKNDTIKKTTVDTLSSSSDTPDQDPGYQAPLSGPNNEYPTPVSSPRVQHNAQEKDDNVDPTDVHEEFDSILESEGFTMISLDSIPSARHFISSPAETETRNVSYATTSTSRSPLEESFANPNARLSARDQGSPALPNQRTLHAIRSDTHDQSEISSTMPSSPPSSLDVAPSSSGPLPRLKGQTPDANVLSPKLPSPPRVVAHELAINFEEQPTPPRLARVVRAGIALQGVLSPKPRIQGGTSPLRNFITPGEHSSPNTTAPSSLFSGLDVGTKRELRTGFRLGEELAKQRSRSLSPLEPRSALSQHHAKQPHTPTRETPRIPGIDTIVAQRERQWQSEREAISREIEMADTSQVIVIESDNEEGESRSASKTIEYDAANAEAFDSDDEDDIWLQEAHEPCQNSDPSPPAQKEMSHVSQPKRSTITSPWKRGEDVNQSTYISQGDVSGIFWKPPNRCVSKLQIPQSKSPEKPFDLAKILGVRPSPKKVTLSPRKDYFGTLELEASLVEDDELVSANVDEDESQHSFTEAADDSVDFNDDTGNEDVLAVREQRPVYETIAENTTPGLEQREEDSTGIESNASSLADSIIPPVKIPVNFGDESSLTRDGGTYILDSNEPDILSRSPSSIEDRTCGGNETTTLPEAFATNRGGWLGRIGSIATSWSYPADQGHNANEATQPRTIEEAEDEGYRRTTLAFQGRHSHVPLSAEQPSSSKPSKNATPRPPPHGPWTKPHYRALHRLYLKSLKRNCPKYTVANLRPGLKSLLNQTAMSSTGSHEEQVVMTLKELAVVEEFMRSLEKDWPGQEIEWTEEDLGMRLYSIIIGYRVRGDVPRV